MKSTECARTSSLNEGCYYKSAINYAMYGRACALCSARFGAVIDPWRLGNVIAYVLYWKKTQYGLNDESLAAIPFVIYGHTGNLTSGGSRGISCIPNPTLARNLSFHWHWLPAKTMDLAPEGGFPITCAQ